MAFVSSDPSLGQTLLQLCVEGEVVPELQTEQLSEAGPQLHQTSQFWLVVTGTMEFSWLIYG